MEIDDQTLPSLRDFASLKRVFEQHVVEFTRPALLAPKFSDARLREAHYAWLGDIKRIESAEPNLREGLDHFKQCAHLAYWLRRRCNIVDYKDFDDGYLYEDERQRRDLIRLYGEEFLAFDFGLQICTYYELEKIGATRTQEPRLSIEFIRDLCHMLKFKHVSPHAMYLIYRSILM